MATDIHIKLDGIKGESKDDKHKDEIQIDNVSWGVVQQGTFGSGGGGGAGKASAQDIHFSKMVDKASPTLFLKCATGTHIPTATITFRKAGDKPQEFLKIVLTNILVSSIQNSGSAAGSIPTESISLNFSKIEITYQEQDAKGAVGGPVISGYDFSVNKKT